MSAWGGGPSWQGSSGPMFERRDGSLVHEWGEEQSRVPPTEGAQFQYNSRHVHGPQHQRLNQPSYDPPQRWNNSR